MPTPDPYKQNIARLEAAVKELCESMRAIEAEESAGDQQLDVDGAISVLVARSVIDAVSKTLDVFRMRRAAGVINQGHAEKGALKFEELGGCELASVFSDEG